MRTYETLTIPEEKLAVSGGTDLALYQDMLRRSQIFHTVSRSYHRPSRQETIDVSVRCGPIVTVHTFSAEGGQLLEVDSYD